MKLFKAGDRSQAICPACEEVVGTTFAYRDVPFDDGSGVVKDILVGVCDRCSAILSIPAQSTPAIRHVRDVADVSLEVVLSAPDLEVLDAAIYRIDPQATGRFRKSLFTYYINKISSDSNYRERLRAHIMKHKATRAAYRRKKAPIKIPRKRLSFKINPRTDEQIRFLMEGSGLAKTELVIGVLGEIEEELVLPQVPMELKKLQDIAAVINA